MLDNLSPISDLSYIKDIASGSLEIFRKARNFLLRKLNLKVLNYVRPTPDLVIKPLLCMGASQSEAICQSQMGAEEPEEQLW